MTPGEIHACIHGYQEKQKANVQAQQYLNAQAAIMYGRVWASYYAHMKKWGGRRPITKISELIQIQGESEDKKTKSNLPQTPEDYYELKEKLMEKYGIKNGGNG